MMAERDDFLHATFPAGFMWCTASASYQIEGAWDKGGRGESIWDRFCHEGDHILNGDTGDVACDSYHRYNDDVSLLKDVGVSHYRFSLSWSRILPDGTTKTVNQEGIVYYNRLIDALRTAGIEPVVTLYHWDLPQALQDEGGWINDDVIGFFEAYAGLCYENFGDRVKWWITINEPGVTAWLGHGIGIHAPGIRDPFNAFFKVSHNLIRAHARAYHLYVKDFRKDQQGKISIAISADWLEPRDRSNPSDQAASEIGMATRIGWYAQPVFGDGDYPQYVKDMAAKMVKRAGLPHNPLPQFTAEEIALNKGSSDFYGLNNYTSRLVSAMDIDNLPLSEETVKKMGQSAMIGVQEDTDPQWTRGKSAWLYSVPWGLRELLKYIKDTYGNPSIFITENGFSDDGDLEDTRRIDYLKSHMNNVLKAIKLDNCDVIGYTVWSLLDNFEWAQGYSERFGIYHVDFKDPARPRTPKASVAFVRKVVQNNGFPDENNSMHEH